MADNEKKIPWGKLIVGAILLMMAPSIIGWVTNQLLAASYAAQGGFFQMGEALRGLLQATIRLGVNVLIFMAVIMGLGLGAKKMFAAFKKAGDTGGTP